MRSGELLGDQGGEMPAPFVGLEEDLVREHIELLLRFPLDILAARLAEHLTQRPFADRDRDLLAGARHHFDQQAQRRIDAAGVLPFDEVSGERDPRHRASFARRGAGIVRRRARPVAKGDNPASCTDCASSTRTPAASPPA